jgi:hypothetical protein
MSHDPAKTPNVAFPRLTPANHRITSPVAEDHNCIAWAAGDTSRWWEPTEYWPDPSGQFGFDLTDLIRMYGGLGYVPCPDGVPEPGFERIAVYADAGRRYTHAARQLVNGKWTSKLGKWEDIEHDTPDDVAGGAYGTVAGFLKRPLAT